MVNAHVAGRHVVAVNQCVERRAVDVCVLPPALVVCLDVFLAGQQAVAVAQVVLPGHLVSYVKGRAVDWERLVERNRTPSAFANCASLLVQRLLVKVVGYEYPHGVFCCRRLHVQAHAGHVVAFVHLHSGLREVQRRTTRAPVLHKLERHAVLLAVAELHFCVVVGHGRTRHEDRKQ